MSARPSLLVLNAGSSSLKFALFVVADGACTPCLRGLVESIGAGSRARLEDAQGREIRDDHSPGLESHEAALAWALAAVDSRPEGRGLAAAGHRVVHGGERFTAPVVVDDAAIDAMQSLVPLAPLHQPHNVAAVRALARARPGLPQVACFDTAFHHGMPEAARRYALPESITRLGIRRYGFHGLSYEAVAEALPRLLVDQGRDRVVAAHLGNGTSLCALRAGRSVDTTMGLTPLDGLVMGTRAGSVDPGVLLYLMREHGYDEPRLARLLYHESGLLGVSGRTRDMGSLLASSEPSARLAVELFVHRLVREVGAMAASLGGIEALVFTGGIGERAAAIRAAACERLAWLGLALDPLANASHGPRITQPGSRVSAWVFPADEEGVIARHTARLLRIA